MAFDTYANLQIAITNWLDRSDMASVVPDFIALAEVEMKRTIDKWTTRNPTFSIAGATVNAPADLMTPRSIRLISASPERDLPMRLCTIEMLNERKARGANTPGRPTDVAFVNGVFYFAPEPDQAYTAELFYFSTLTPLSNSNPSNSVLVEAPDAYLYGALMQAAPYLEHDDRTPLWEGKFNKAIAQLNELREKQEYTLSIRDVRLPRSFG